MKIAVSLFQKNNSKHLLEWFAWYHMIGVDTFLVFDHMSTDDSYEIIKTLSKFYDIRHMQIEGNYAGLKYWEYVFQHRASGEFDWIISADADEIYVPMIHSNIKDFLKDYMDKHLSCLGIYWTMFGNNGHINWEPGFVTECYTRRGPLNHRLNHHVKSILRGGPAGGNIWERNDGHLLFTQHGTFDLEGRPITGGLNYPCEAISHDKLRIHHYYSKSWEYFKTIKQVVGQRADRAPNTPGEIPPDELWHEQNLNDEEDTVAWDKFGEKLKVIYNIMKEQVDSLLIKKIVFFNHRRNGDIFIGKSYVRKIIENFPHVEFFYAHNNHPSLIQDIPYQLIGTDQLPENLTDVVKYYHDKNNNTMYINTWLGSWWDTGIFEDNIHANFKILHNIWKNYFKLLNLPISDDSKEFLPTIEFNKFDLDRAHKYIYDKVNKEIILFCNSPQQSAQSDVGDMYNVIDVLSTKYPNIEFLVTHKLDLVKPNITYTDDIFESNIGNLNQISYLSRYAKIIIGKNSGPYSFCHTKENLNNEKKLFICFSNNPKEILTAENSYSAPVAFSQSVNDYDIINQIDYYIEKKTIIFWLPHMNDAIRFKFDGYEKIKEVYSQCYQDVLVLSLTRLNKLQKTYLEIGANGAYFANNTYLLSKNFGWKGVSIEIDKQHEPSWKYFRKNDKILFCDALTSNYEDILYQNFETNVIDYLQLDIDPSINTLQALKKLPHENYRFKIITFETDAYQGDLRARDQSRQFLTDLGYTLIVPDVIVPWVLDFDGPFEDWWVDLNLVDKKAALELKNLSQNTRHPVKLLFK